MKFNEIKREKDRIALVGFADTSRDLTPWDDPSFDIMGVNEGYAFPWMKRWTHWMQIHPKWDLMRDNNQNDPNHWLWLTNTEGTCLHCKGKGKLVPLLTKNPQPVDCVSCKGTGYYTPPESRLGFPIFMQKEYKNIPGAVALPLQEIADALMPEENNNHMYFMSSFAYMLGVSYLMGYKEIHLFGFEMGAGTEYAYQKSNAEYIIGLVQSKGVKVIFPRGATMLDGPLYAYKSMQIGFRQNLELRKVFLNEQAKQETKTLNEMNGRVFTLKQLEHPDAVVAEAEMKKQLQLINGIRFAVGEVGLLTKLYDAYFWSGSSKSEGGDDDDDTPIAHGPSPDTLNRFLTVAYKSGASNAEA